MNLQNLVVVALRLIALNSIIETIVWLLAQLTPILRFFSPEGLSLKVILLICFFGLLLITFAVLLWVFAIPAARFITKGIDRDISFSPISLLDCYTIAFVGIGLFYGVRCLPDAGYWIYNIFKAVAFNAGREWKERIDFYQAMQAVIPFVVGLILLFQGRSLAVLLMRKQEKKEFSDTN